MLDYGRSRPRQPSVLLRLIVNAVDACVLARDNPSPQDQQADTANQRITDAGLPRLYHPSEIADALGCSEWWVKEQARQHRIPFTRLGGAYRFTAEHFAGIIRLFEEGPPKSAEPARGGSVSSKPPRPAEIAPPGVHLRAKRPRRMSRPEHASTAA
ncbi:helix-turn-helix domain-containing protein [Streptomyces abikoensis]|uniref:helix-turn-helix domain-containing protein n=1 Tax=Streptomyces abikoensis TaxID=97398 RepID=UPI0036AB5401